MVTYPLFHRELHDNLQGTLANPLECHRFASEPREEKVLMGHTFYEFFAGGGMARAGLGPGWNCLFANDFDHKKGRIYRINWGDAELKTADIRSLTTSDIPNTADLVWGSFPCQDLSLAGAGAGLKGDRSGTFWPFWNLMTYLIKEGRSPRLIVLENVCGTLTSHEGKDFATICGAFEQTGYNVGALVVDAALFLPQSRPRLFIIGIHGEEELPEGLTGNETIAPYHTRALIQAHRNLPPKTKRAWLWWRIPLPPKRRLNLSELIEDFSDKADWFTQEKTQQLLDMMSPVNRAKVAEAQRQKRRIVGSVYKRTRPNELGRKVQRAEARFDDISGCLRTPAGGSSRQVIVVVDGKSVKARLISSRETARLMGLPDDYVLPANYNEAYHLTGDGVVVPVVRHLAANILEPILVPSQARTTVAA
jgi:DNA (cytosine-5)-methyltransferase 1